MININKITEAIESLIQRAKNELVGHIDAKNQETMGMKGLINEILKKLGENEQKMAEMKSIMTEKNNEIAQLKLKIDTIGDSIPQEIKQARIQQNEARVKEKLELQKPESADEKTDYRAMANQILDRLSSSSDVVIEENLPSEVIQMLLVKEDVTVNFIDGHIVVAKKSKEQLVEFDKNAIIKDYQEKRKLDAKIKYGSVLSKQMAFVKEKVEEQIALFKENPYRYKNVELTGSHADNPMYMKIDRLRIRFVILDEIMKYLLKHDMVMEFVPTDSSKEVGLRTKGYYDIYFLSADDFQLEINSNLFDQQYDCYVAENFTKIRLHILSEAEKANIPKIKK